MTLDEINRMNRQTKRYIIASVLVSLTSITISIVSMIR